MGKTITVEARFVKNLEKFQSYYGEYMSIIKCFDEKERGPYIDRYDRDMEKLIKAIDKMVSARYGVSVRAHMKRYHSLVGVTMEGIESITMFVAMYTMAADHINMVWEDTVVDRDLAAHLIAGTAASIDYSDYAKKFKPTDAIAVVPHDTAGVDSEIIETASDPNTAVNNDIPMSDKLATMMQMKMDDPEKYAEIYSGDADFSDVAEEAVRQYNAKTDMDKEASESV